MKTGIHPNYEKAAIKCACGAIIETYSTAGTYTIDVCSSCHPFYTGKQKLLDTAGRVDRFKRKYGDIIPKKKPSADASPPQPAAAAPEPAAAPPDPAVPSDMS